MAKFLMIDIVKAVWPHTMDYSETQSFDVSDRADARRILKHDLQQTADPQWSADLLARFDAGENSIEVPNGREYSFKIVYLEDLQ